MERRCEYCRGGSGTPCTCNAADLSESSLNVGLADLELLLSFVPDWVKIVPKGLGAEFYGTLSYEGDLEVKKRVDALLDKLGELGR